MKEKIANFFKGQILTSIIYIALGLCLMLMPVKTVYMICKVVFGIVLILTGIYHIVLYLLEKKNETVFDMFSGAIIMIFGGFLFFNPQIVMKLLPILLGTLILIDSVWSMKGAFRLKKRQRKEWKFLLIGSILFVGLGIILIINPFAMARYTAIFAGAILVANGTMDVLFMILLKIGMRERKEQVEQKETLETETDNEEKAEDIKSVNDEEILSNTGSDRAEKENEIDENE